MPPSINVSTPPTATAITRKPLTTQTAEKGSAVVLSKREASGNRNVSLKRRETRTLQRQQQEGRSNAEGEEGLKTTATPTSTELSTDTMPNNGDNLMTGMGTGGMYGAAGGYGMMSPYGMMGMGGYGMGGYGMGGYGMGMMGGPFSGLNNFLFGVQNVIFSLGQAVQILGMNTHALQQLYETAKSMIEQTLSSLNQLRLLDGTTTSNTLIKHQTEEERKRKRRLQALRWSLMLSVSYAAYRIVRYLMRRNIRQRQHCRHLPSSSSSYLHRGSYAPNTSSYHSTNNSYYNDNYSNNRSNGRMSSMGDFETHHEPAMYGGYGDRMSSYTSSMGRQRYSNTGRGQGRYGYYDNDYY